MSNPSAAKIPRAFRKPLTNRRFNKLLSMLTDKREEQLVKAHFTGDSRGRYVYSEPADRKKAGRLRDILKKVHKARSGPRSIRIGFVLAMTGLPVLFGLFFLDPLAARFIERNLENLTGTDVSLDDFDISLAGGRLELGYLGFASTTDPMIDSVILENIDVDLRMSALLFRRINIDTIAGGLDFNRRREVAADYPSSGSRNAGMTGNSRGIETSIAVDSIITMMDLDTVLPEASLELAEELRAEAEIEYRTWAADLERDGERIGSLIERITEFVDRPMPDTGNIPAWLERIDEGRALAAELEGLEPLPSDYIRGISNSVSTISDNRLEIAAALENDLASLESAVPDDEDLERLMAGLVSAYLGPRSAKAVDTGRTLYRRFEGGSSSESAGDVDGVPRRSRGRVVRFPARLPPRFTITTLALSGPGTEVSGTDIGTDHDIVGAASTIKLKMDGVTGIPGSLIVDAAIDGRTGEAPFFQGRARATGFPWEHQSGDDIAGGSVTADAAFRQEVIGESIMTAEGTVALDSWREGSGALGFITSEAPPLNFGFDGRFSPNGIDELNLTLAPGTMAPWAGLIAEAFIGPGNLDAARRLEEAVGVELAELDDIGDLWTAGNADVDVLDRQLSAADSELTSMLEELIAGSGADLPIDVPGGALEGLRSLF